MTYYEVDISGAKLISALKKPIDHETFPPAPVVIQVKKGHTKEELHELLTSVQHAVFDVSQMDKKPKAPTKIFKFPAQAEEIKAAILAGHEAYRESVAYTVTGIITLDGNMMFQAGFTFSHMSNEDALRAVAEWIISRRGYDCDGVRFSLHNEEDASRLDLYYDEKVVVTLNVHPVPPLDVTFAAMHECFFGSMTFGYTSRCH